MEALQRNVMLFLNAISVDTHMNLGVIQYICTRDHTNIIGENCITFVLTKMIA